MLSHSDKKQILCVDDHQDSLDLLSTWLELCGYLATAASTMNEALLLAKNNHFDLYIFEGHLLDMEKGDGLCERIRSVDPCTPLVVYSADTRESTRMRFLSTLAQAYLNKPIDIDVIADVVKDLIEHRAYAVEPTVM